MAAWFSLAVMAPIEARAAGAAYQVDTAEVSKPDPARSSPGPRLRAIGIFSVR
jgi:hypothetical protein